MEKALLIISENTAGMLLIDKTLRQNSIPTDLVPAPPESGTVCAIAVKIKESYLNRAIEIINENNISVAGVFEDRKLKLQGLVDRKLGVSVTEEFLEILKRIEAGDELNKQDIVYLLSTGREKEINAVFGAADRIRRETVGDTLK
jgi:biotin synthase